jgi:hypothetical protein
MNIEEVRRVKSVVRADVIGSSYPLGAAFPAGAMSIVTQSRRGVALGITAKGGEYGLAVRFQRGALRTQAIEEAIKKRASGEVDFRYVGRLVKHVADKTSPTPEQKKTRPLRIGSSISHIDVTAGTIGAFVRDKANQATLILSNNHVLANENHAKEGDIILQPGCYDLPAHLPDQTYAVAKLLRFVRLRKKIANRVDAAVALLDEGIKANWTKVKPPLKLTGLRQGLPPIGSIVYKLGRTTGWTRGRLVAIEVDDLLIEYGHPDAPVTLGFDGQIEIEGADDGPFSQGGDSGSLIFDKDGCAFGLLFAGGQVGGSNGQGLTYANPLESVLTSLEIEFPF